MFDESQDTAFPAFPSTIVDFVFCNLITKNIQSSSSKFVVLATVPLQATVSMGTSSWVEAGRFLPGLLSFLPTHRHYSAGGGNGKDPQMTVTKTQDAATLKNVVEGVCTLEYSQNYDKHSQI